MGQDEKDFKSKAKNFSERKAMPTHHAGNWLQWFCTWANKGKEYENIKKVKGPALFLLPFHRGGAHDPKAQGAAGQSMWMYLGKKATDFMKAKLVDYFTLKEE